MLQLMSSLIHVSGQLSYWVHVELWQQAKFCHLQFKSNALSSLISSFDYFPHDLIKEGETLPYDCFSTVHVGLVGMAGDVLLNCVLLNDYELILQAHLYVNDTIHNQFSSLYSN